MLGLMGRRTVWPKYLLRRRLKRRGLSGKISAPREKSSLLKSFLEKYPELSSKFQELVSASWLITISLSSISHSRVWQSDPIFWTKIQDAWTERDNIKNTMLEKSRKYGGFGCNNYCRVNTFCFWHLRYENFEKELWREAISFLNRIQRFQEKLWKAQVGRGSVLRMEPWDSRKSGGREMSCASLKIPS